MHRPGSSATPPLPSARHGRATLRCPAAAGRRYPAAAAPPAWPGPRDSDSRALECPARALSSQASPGGSQDLVLVPHHEVADRFGMTAGQAKHMVRDHRETTLPERGFEGHHVLAAPAEAVDHVVILGLARNAEAVEERVHAFF